MLLLAEEKKWLHVSWARGTDWGGWVLWLPYIVTEGVMIVKVCTLHMNLGAVWGEPQQRKQTRHMFPLLCVHAHKASAGCLGLRAMQW